MSYIARPEVAEEDVAVQMRHVALLQNPDIALGGCPMLAFASTVMIAWTDTNPGGKMFSCYGYVGHPFEKEALCAFIASLFLTFRWD